MGEVMLSWTGDGLTFRSQATYGDTILPGEDREGKGAKRKGLITWNESRRRRERCVTLSVCMPHFTWRQFRRMYQKAATCTLIPTPQ